MTNLVLTMVNGEPTVTSRQVAEDFGKEHKNILRDIENIIGGLVNSEHTRKMFNEVQYVHPQNKQTYNEFIMNRDGWTLLAMGFTGSKAIQWKLKYIEAFNAMERQLNTPQLPQTYLEALEALVVSEKSKQIMAPKAEYYDKLCERSHLSNFRDTAKAIGVGQKFFMEYLESHGYIYRDRHGKPRPYASAMDYFEMKDYTGRSTGTQCLITVAGKQRFAKELNVG